MQRINGGIFNAPEYLTRMSVSERDSPMYPSLTMFQNVQELNAYFWLTLKSERLKVCAMRIPLTVFFLVASAVLPSVTRAEAPVFVIIAGRQLE